MSQKPEEAPLHLVAREAWRVGPFQPLSLSAQHPAVGFPFFAAQASPAPTPKLFQAFISAEKGGAEIRLCGRSAKKWERSSQWSEVS